MYRCLSAQVNLQCETIKKKKVNAAMNATKGNILNLYKTLSYKYLTTCSLFLFYYDKIKSRFGRPSILQLYIVNLTDAISNRVFEQTRQSRHKMKYLY